MERTYSSWTTWERPSLQKEYTEETPLLDEHGTVLAAGWARRNVFRYDRNRVRHVMRRKEWDFYQISDGSLMLQVSFANISLGGYASAVLVDLRKGKTLFSDMAPFVGGKDRYVLPAKGDVPNYINFRVGKTLFEVNTGAERRQIRYKNDHVECSVSMEIPAGLENITTVLPFWGCPDRPQNRTGCHVKPLSKRTGRHGPFQRTTASVSWTGGVSVRRMRWCGIGETAPDG